MATVYQFGNAQFAKDLVFGWQFRRNDESRWEKLLDFPTDVLKDLSTASFPAYVPNDFQESIRNELERRKVHKAQALEMGIIASGAWKKYDDSLADAKAASSRLGDRTKLLEEILSKIVLGTEPNTFTIDLGYVKINRGEFVWFIPGKEGEQPLMFTGISGVVDHILKKWW